MATRIAVIEADLSLTSAIRSRLDGDTYGVDIFNSLRSFLAVADGTDYAVIVVDAVEVDLSVLSVIQSVCSGGQGKAMMLAVVQGAARERIEAFEAGADDSMSHTVDAKELVLRIEHLLVRFSSQESSHSRGKALTGGDIYLNPDSYEVVVAGEPVDLTVTEFKLLHLLMTRHGRVQNREHLLVNVWDYDSGLETRTVDTHVKRLRAKLGESGAFIETVRGVGYRFTSGRKVRV